MAPVLVLAECDAIDGTVSRSTCVLLTIARRLGTPITVLCGTPSARATEWLGRYGAETVYVTDGFPTPSRADAIVAVAERTSPAAILIAAGYVGQEAAARAAVRLNSGIITDAVEVRPGGAPSPGRDARTRTAEAVAGGPTAVQVCLADSYLVESEVRRGIPIITVRPEAAVPRAASATSPIKPRIETIAVAPSPAGVRRVSRTPRPVNRRPELETADIVVAGGRGVGSQAAFTMVELIAQALGGAVAGSHTATELGWCPRDLRVGLTGHTVRPRLYVAAGISGSVRHRAGMQGSKIVVAIGDDRNTPIFRIADLGVVGDVHEILPALLAEVSRRKAQRTIAPTVQRNLAEA